MLATSKVNAKGKVVKVYKHADVKTLLAALVLLNELGLVKFKTETMLADLLTRAKQQTDLAAAQIMQKARANYLPALQNQNNEHDASGHCRHGFTEYLRTWVNHA